jgi:hypothetical protein
VILDNIIITILLAVIIAGSLSSSIILTTNNLHQVLAQTRADTTSDHLGPNFQPASGTSPTLKEGYRFDLIVDKTSTSNTSQIVTPRAHFVPIIPYFIFPQQQQQNLHPTIIQKIGTIQRQMSKGTINSLIKTPTAEWIASGNWSMNLNNGNVTFFKTDMTWFNNNGMTSHTHQFQNFRSAATGGNMTSIVHPGTNVFLKGVMDVGTNHRIVWKNVPTTISIHGGKTITISVDNNATNHHFAGQPIFGLVTSSIP